MDHTIQFVRGDTHIISLSVTDANNNPYIPKETDVLKMTVRLNDYKGAVAIQKVSGDGDIIQTSSGWDITIQPEDTAELAYKPYVYDIELNMLGVVQTVIPYSKFILDKEVTY